MPNLYEVFFQPGEVVELRAMGLRGKSKLWGNDWASGIVYGYFDNAEALDAAARSLDDDGLKADGIYFTLNPCLPDLLARGANRLVASSPKRPQTNDQQVAAIRWLPIDLDPQRPAGISASEEELAAAGEVGKKVRAFLEQELGFPAGIRALSGNGYHLLYRLPDLTPGGEVSERDGLVHRALGALAARFNTSMVKIDEVNFNASRIWKFYGTMARKGDNIPARPHRRSQLFSETPASLAAVPALSKEQLATLAALAPGPEGKSSTPAPTTLPATPGQPATGGKKGYNKPAATGAAQPMPGRGLGPLMVDRYLAHYGRDVVRVKEDRGTTRYCLAECLFDPNHKGGEAAIVASPNPPFLTYHCFHNSCQGYTWKDARALISGKDPLAPFCENYNPNWTPPRQVGSGELAKVEPGGALVGSVAVGSGLVLPPSEIDPAEFFVNRGKRASYAAKLMSNYLAQYLYPIVHTNGRWWRYGGGVWKEFSRHEVSKIISACLGELVQAGWLNTTQDIMAADLNFEEERWDAGQNERYINLANGMLDLGTNELVEHHPEYWSRVQLPVDHNPAATCPTWHSALGEIFRDVPAKALILQEFFGYILLATCRYEKCLFMYGTGANGKSTVLNVIEYLVGTPNVCSLSLDDMSKTFSIPYLQGKMVNISSEVDTREKAGTENLKKAISGDLLTGEQKFGDKVTFRNQAKFLFAMNSPPTITDKAHGFARKVIVLNFNRRFQDHEMDRTLSSRLKDELPGILNWALEGLYRLLDQDGFSELAEVKKENEAFLKALNPVLVFIEEECMVHADCWVGKQDLFNAYTEWCVTSGYNRLAKGKFYEQITSQVPAVSEKRKRLSDNDTAGSRLSAFEGIGLRAVFERMYPADAE